ncbi:N-acetylmuramoyl-L-alanine amidase family protein [Pseudothauera rhizosphaerae]|uniref:N-acetylmuramoyl-L-alanine amidase n=1 Tax=Pseudothauera rhizosphaerae TaxID=2565932 RepID=A0A4S4AMW1_9RHOO|nr:N-acetylmuramoyl-L-alanine amidase [Pseudothauera rhizosphaerae]THF60951.1 N-acetylmuramoyl-L-alanine amidase [Pseudothauera rhizosphaerae]
MGSADSSRASFHYAIALAGLLLALAGAPAGAVPRVAVDIGHTEQAPGATSARGRSELSFNRELALHLVEALRMRGLGAVLINADGRIGSLRERPQRAAEAGADFLVSIHHDSVGEHELVQWYWQGREAFYSDRWAGHSLFVSRDNPATARSVLCARAMGARLQRMGFVPTHKNGRRRAYADHALAVHHYDELAVLRHAAMPAVLFEAGVIRHRDEELLLADPAYQARMADGLATAIAACLLAGEPAEDEAAADARGADRRSAPGGN